MFFMVAMDIPPLVCSGLSSTCIKINACVPITANTTAININPIPTLIMKLSTLDPNAAPQNHTHPQSSAVLLTVIVSTIPSMKLPYMQP